MKSLLVTVVYLLALASILVTRILKAFTVAEVLAVLAFVCGLIALWLYRKEAAGVAISWWLRLIGVASVVGLIGVPLKLLFSLLGIGAAEHDMANHAEAAGNPLLLHIHHLFFNLGFLILLISLVVMLATMLKAKNS